MEKEAQMESVEYDSWQEFGDLESQVLPLPKGCNSAHVTNTLQAMSSFPGYLRDPGSQPANPG